MVKVRETHSDGTSLDIDAWIAHLVENKPWEEGVVQQLRRAVMASQTAPVATTDDDHDSPGADSFLTGLDMAEILADLYMDVEGLQASILYRSVREHGITLEEVRKAFGNGVASLIDGVLQMAVISGLRNDSEQGVFGQAATRQAAMVREMLVSIIDDVRVALIKIAERTCAIRAVKNAPEAKRTRVAREIMDVYAPLAHRLGVGHLKWELEDLAFRFLEPEGYKQIAHLLDEKRLDRQSYIDEVMNAIRVELRKLGKQCEVSGRVKHIYSIWRKMQRKEIGFSEIYDIRAIRVLVPTVADCYAVLGIVHSKWRNIPNEFDDYIASPKENGYRSLHTAVIGPGRKVIEIQIRTYDMHAEAEYGICAHWQYKGTDTEAAARNYETKIAWLRQVLEWHEEVGSDNVKEIFRRDSSPDRVYLFTPDGHVVDLPQGATPVDFAYRIHTVIGHRCRGAKINGKIVPLNTPLQTGDQVEILTGRAEAPRRDWLSKSLGYLTTAKARAKIQQWFRAQDREQNIIAGKTMIEREFRQLGLVLSAADIEAMATRFNKRGSDGLYAAIGAGDVGQDQVVRAAQSALGELKAPQRRPRAIAASRYGQSDFYIYGVGNLLTSVAKCCSPLPGDAICGYLTSGRGVTIHRKDCGNLLRLQSEDSQRILQVTWGGTPKQMYPVRVGIESFDRTGLLRDITTAIDKAGLSIIALVSDEERDGLIVTELKVEVPGIEELSSLLARLRQVPNVTDVYRVVE